MRFAVIDLANLFHRAQHAVKGDAFTKAGMALHIVFRSLRRLHKEMQVDHMVFCTEGRSWRYEVYPQYKAKRKLDRMTRSPSEQEEDEVFFSVLDDFINFIAEKTRCTLLNSAGIEGDDFVARWIQLHPDDEHIILSGDSDFFQLLAPNVKLMDGVQERLISCDGVVDFNGNPMAFTVDPSKGKLKVLGTIADCAKKHKAEQKEKQKKDPSHKVTEYSFSPEPEWWKKALFIKIVRGDTGDGIFSAYPGVRYEGSSKKTGIREAWEDRNGQGFNWNNFMLQNWEKLIGADQNGNKITKMVQVRDEFSFNEMLIDLTKQPENIKDLMDQVIVQAVQKEPVNNVGIEFLRFCAKHALPRLSKEAAEHSTYLNAPYSKQ